MKTIFSKFVMALMIVAIAMGAFAPAVFAAAPERTKSGNTIVDVVLAENAKSGEFSILIAALKAADPLILRQLGSRAQATVFAPTDAAFQSLLAELGMTADELLSNKKLVTNVLVYHIAYGRLNAKKVLASSQIRMADGRLLFQSGGVLTDEAGRTATIIQTNIKAGNGLIHVIDRVVLPKQPTSGNTIVDIAIAENANSGEFDILIAALKAADPIVLQVLSGWGQFTVFAPTDAAFEALLAELGITADELLGNKKLVTSVLLYHVAYGILDASKVIASSEIQMTDGRFLSQSGGVLTDEQNRTSNIIATDIRAVNGIIHIIDRVVLPANPASANTIVEIVLAENAKSGEFDILIAALQAADPVILQILGGVGQFTVFAPTDAAFEALLAELGMTAEELLGNRDLLNQVLAYHVAPGFLDSTKVIASSQIQMSNGGVLYQNGGVLTDANGRASNIIAVDIKASNGYIHIIDRVILP